MSAFLAFLVGVMMGIPVGYVLGRRSRRVHIPAMDRRPDEERFGHPKPPLKTLRDQLPDAPSGCAWESAVKFDDRGEAHLHLSLVEVATERTVASTKSSLVRGKYGRLYSEEYRKYRTLRADTFNELIGPLVDWATCQVNKYANAGKTYGYRMEA